MHGASQRSAFHPPSSRVTPVRLSTSDSPCSHSLPSLERPAYRNSPAPAARKARPHGSGHGSVLGIHARQRQAR